MVTVSRHLPLEILSNIISRLPLEDIIRCSSVSSYWYQSTKYLPSNHLHCTKSQIFDILLSETNYWSLNKVQVNNSLHMISSNSRRRRDGKCKHKIAHVNNLKGCVVDSCNGLLCLSHSPGGVPCAIYNPIKKQVIMLPELEARSACRCSLGYDPTSNRYKLVVASFYKCGIDSDGYTMKTAGHIITVGESSWRRLQFPEVVKGCIDLDPIFFNGAFHFVNGMQHNSKWSVKDTYQLDGILTIDINTEKVRLVEFSASLDLDTENARVFNIENSIALIGQKDNASWRSFYREKNLEPPTQIWKILGAHADGSCLYQYTILNLAENTKRLFSGKSHLSPIGALGNGNLLFHASDYDPLREHSRMDHLVLYDIEKGEGSALEVASYIPKVFNVFIFQPSLVSPAL